MPTETATWALRDRVALPTGTIAVDVLGEDRPGTPVVLTHGTPSWSYLWRHVAPALAHERPVYLWDLPTYGDSTGHTPSVAGHAQTLAALVGTLGPGRAGARRPRHRRGDGPARAPRARHPGERARPRRRRRARPLGHRDRRPHAEAPRRLRVDAERRVHRADRGPPADDVGHGSGRGGRARLPRALRRSGGPAALPRPGRRLHRGRHPRRRRPPQRDHDPDRRRVGRGGPLAPVHGRDHPAGPHPGCPPPHRGRRRPLPHRGRPGGVPRACSRRCCREPRGGTDHPRRQETDEHHRRLYRCHTKASSHRGDRPGALPDELSHAPRSPPTSPSPRPERTATRPASS